MRDLIRKLFADDEGEEVPPGFVFVIFVIFAIAVVSASVGLGVGYLLFS